MRCLENSWIGFLGRIVGMTAIPGNCIAAGNPAKMIRTGVKCGKYGVILDADNKIK